MSFLRGIFPSYQRNIFFFHRKISILSEDYFLYIRVIFLSYERNISFLREEYFHHIGVIFLSYERNISFLWEEYFHHIR